MEIREVYQRACERWPNLKVTAAQIILTNGTQSCTLTAFPRWDAPGQDPDHTWHADSWDEIWRQIEMEKAA